VKLNSAKLGPDKPADGFNRMCADTALIHGATTNKMSFYYDINTCGLQTHQMLLARKTWTKNMLYKPIL
jgi:hypothetical protein